MKSILIDTNIYSYAMKGDQESVDVLQQASQIGICSITIGELLSGFKAGKKEGENRNELEEFLDTPRVRVYAIDEGTAEFYAEILKYKSPYALAGTKWSQSSKKQIDDLRFLDR